LEPVGSGTERLEEAIHRLFPQARLARLDSEAVRRRTQTRALSQLLGAREIDILIGTEMLFRLALTHRASFVGVPDADAGLHVSDFRSAERTYHALIDAVSLAEPASRGGSVLLQTRFPDHHALTSIASADPAIFLQHERSFRELLQYPPFTHLIRLDVSGRNETVVARAASRWADLLRVMLVAENREVQGTTSKQGRQRGTLESESCGAASILGPSPAAKYFVRGRYSWQILIKSVDLSTGRAVVSKTLERLEREPRPGQLRFAVDVDPVTMA
jgi:primosomal protein N' (replication factor Y)